MGVFMKDAIITLQLVGLESEEGHFRLNAFMQQLQQLSAVLKEADLLVSHEDKPTAYYRIVTLKHSSPGEIGILPIPYSKEKNYGDAIRTTIAKELTSLKEHGSVSEGVGGSFLEALREMITPIGKYFKEATLISNGYRISLDKPLVANINLLLSKEISCHGSMQGYLEVINLHNKNEFRIYPIVGPKVLICFFPKEQRENAKMGLEKNVLVTGEMFYRMNEPFPYKIDVKDIEIYPDEDELPHLIDLKGMAPDATGEMASEDFVRKLRAEW
jgi:hypothetical protein